VDRRQPLAWAAHGLALWDVLTTPDAPSSLAARLRVTEVWSCVDIPAGTAGRLLCLSGKVLGGGGPGCSVIWGEQLWCVILLQALTYGTSGSEGLGGAWVALSALRLQCLEGQAALDAAAAGLAWLRARQEVPPADYAPARFQYRI
jgi:hypothetical protein